eukprot:1900505-Rhodomonas_salina.1
MSCGVQECVAGLIAAQGTWGCIVAEGQAAAEDAQAATAHSRYSVHSTLYDTTLPAMYHTHTTTPGNVPCYAPATRCPGLMGAGVSGRGREPKVRDHVQDGDRIP